LLHPRRPAKQAEKTEAEKTGTDHVFLLDLVRCYAAIVFEILLSIPRRARIIAAGYPMHVILRGIDRAAVFFEDDDRQFFLDHLAAVAAEESVAVHAYVLMTNHLHLLMTAARDDGVSAVMKRVGPSRISWDCFIM
jgi:hypothetical protein